MSKLPDLRLLSQFLIVAEEPSLSAAARKLGVTTAAVSQAMVRLEQEYGTSLMERNSRGMRLTPAGALLRHHARELIGAAEDMVDALAPYQKHPLPRLRVHVIETVSRYVVPSLITHLNDQVGELTVSTGRQSDYPEHLLRGNLDVAVGPEDMSEIPSLTSIPLCTERLVALMPTSIPRHLRKMEHLSQLPLLRISHSRRLGDLVSNLMDDYHIAPKRIVECSSYAAVLDLVSEGFGWTVTTPFSVCHQLAETTNVAWIPVPGDRYCRTIYLLAARDGLLDLPDHMAELCAKALEAEIARWTSGLQSEIRPLVATARVSKKSGQTSSDRSLSLPARPH